TSLLAGQTTSGSTNGTGSAAKFSEPSDIAFDPEGNVYVVDELNNEIREITPTGVVTTFAGQTGSANTNGTGAAAKFNHPQGIITDSSGNFYVADTGNNEIREITP